MRKAEYAFCIGLHPAFAMTGTSLGSRQISMQMILVLQQLTYIDIRAIMTTVTSREEYIHES